MVFSWVNVCAVGRQPWFNPQHCRNWEWQCMPAKKVEEERPGVKGHEAKRGFLFVLF